MSFYVCVRVYTCIYLTCVCVCLSRLKRTSPTAYCDCWEKCKCKTLIAGQKAARLDLLYRLLTTTNLVTSPNSRSVYFPAAAQKITHLLH